jgi:hypothetical protein
VATVADPASGSEHISEEGGPTLPTHRFENYELMLDREGRPIELGRGAMGVTYKALDVDLRCPVTLKVISERYLSEESARLRFFARGARSSQRSSSKCCLSIPPGPNREQLFLCDGVRGGRDP